MNIDMRQQLFFISSFPGQERSEGASRTQTQNKINNIHLDHILIQ
jgi:hypothetical protein